MIRNNLKFLIIGILSFFALIFSLFRVVPFTITADTYIGVIVTLLSVVVTVVIGYQIFNVIEFKSKLESQIKENTALRNEIVQTKEQVIKMNEDLQERIRKNELLSLMRDRENEAQYKFESNPEKNCIESISNILNAIYYGLESDCSYAVILFHHLRKYLTYVTPHALQIFGTTQQGKNGVRYICRGTEMIEISEWIEEIQCATISEVDKRIRNHKQYDSIKSEYARTMKIFEDRIQRIKEDPIITFTPEENSAIMDDSPLWL